MTTETSRMAEQANRQRSEFAQQQILLSQQRIQANQQRLAQLEAQKRINQAMPNNDSNSQVSNTQNYVIAGLIALVLVLAFVLGSVWQKNK